MSRLRRMPRQSAPRPVRRRSYDQFCAAARALDSVGDRWTLLIVRELLAGPRRYTDLHADLPGVCTDVLASRLKDMEQGGLATRRRLPPPGRRIGLRTDRARPRAAARPRRRSPSGARPRSPSAGPPTRCGPTGSRCRCCARWTGLTHEGVLEVRLDEGEFHVRTGRWARRWRRRRTGSARRPQPDARITLDAELCLELGRGDVTLAEAVKDGRIEVAGDGPLAAELRGG